jgi:acetyl esterase/lipase
MKRLLMLSFLFYMATNVWAQELSEYKKVDYPSGYTAQLDAVYITVDGWDGRMDLYLPPKGKDPSALIINIHGGGWVNGVKESQGGFSGFFKAGYAVANIEYRIAKQATAPAEVQDTRCALIYLIKNAKALNIDVNKIVIMGGSAGGHLALMGGLLANDNRIDTNCTGVKNVKVFAIIDRYGIADVNDWAYGVMKSKSATKWLGDKATDDVFINSVSPVNYLTKKSPPIFIVHGDADPTVPYQQSVDLKKRLDELGVKNEFMTILGGTHGKFSADEYREISDRIMNFLKGLGL